MGGVTMQQRQKLSGHQGENAKFANNGSYESVERMLTKLAIRCHSRVNAMGLSMTMEDVKQEMNLTYVMAKDQWSPDRGVLFSTYLTTCCYRNFNERIRRMETERRNLGLIPMSDMRKANGHDDEDHDPMEFMDSEGAELMQVSGVYVGFDAIEGSTTGQVEAQMCDPLLMFEHAEQVKEARDKLTALTDNAKAVIAQLVRAAQERTDDNERLPKLSALMNKGGFSEAERRRIRKEIILAFGVRV